MSGLFRGYVPTENKQCLKKFKDKDIAGYREVKNLPEYAGVLADDVILIDVDDYEQSEILMAIVEDKELLCRVYKTSRGKHFLFKNPLKDNGEYGVPRCGTHRNLACGIVADIKVGCRNSYSILKYDNKEREILYDIFEGEEYQEIPKFLYPLPTKRSLPFLTMAGGDGRNQALFNYILTLQSNDYSVEEARETIRVINRYVLDESLEDEELETILRDESFKKPVFFNKNTFLFDKFATFLKNNAHIVKINGQLCVYQDGVYVAGWEYISKEMIKHIPTLKDSQRQEVIKYLNLICAEHPVSDTNLIPFANGIYNLATGEMEDFSPDKILLNKINYDYNPDAYNELMDKTLDKLSCNDKEVRRLIECCVGYCFFRKCELRKCFILTGEKRNGKSTFLDCINTILGENNIAHLDLKELGEKFKTYELFGKLANIGDDIDGEFITNTAIFKKLVSGNPVSIERKYSDSFSFRNYAKLIFSANNIPRMGKGKDGGAIIDRMIIIPFNATFSKNDPDYDPFIKYKLIEKEPLEYLIKLGVDALRDLLAEQSFPTSRVVETAIKEYEENNNPIMVFFEDTDKKDVVNQDSMEIYKKYVAFCNVNNFSPLSNIEFTRQTNKYYGLKIVRRSINKVKYKIFVESEG